MAPDIAPSRLSPEQLAQNFAEVHPPYSREEAVTEAHRCLYCYDAPCIRACPTHIQIPSFIKKIATDNLRGSSRVILDANPLGLTCARVCPVEQLCEGACVLGAHHRPIAIGRLQRHATDWLLASGEQPFTAGPPNGRRVAVIGSGPAGLACAITLARMGYEVTCYESKDRPGGLDTFGIVSFREPVEIALAEARFAEQMGVRFKLRTQVGRDVAVEKLVQGFDAVFVGVGLGHVPRLGIPGEDLPEVLDALTYIERTKTEALETIPVGRRVVVIGAGNTAIDAATASRRLGAEEVTIVYRRTAAEMPAYLFEYEFAKQDGVAFRWLTGPVRVLEHDGRVAGLECIRMRLGPPDAKGRPRPEPIEGSEFVVEADVVVKAIGQEGRMGFLDVLALERRNGRLAIDPETGATSHPKVFAAGDCTGAGGEEATVVAVVEAGKRVALAIDRALHPASNGSRGA